MVSEDDEIMSLPDTLVFLLFLTIDSLPGSKDMVMAFHFVDSPISP